MVHPIAQAVLDWFADNRRDLPWRRTRDPYAVWVSEIMLQQTRVEAARPYFRRWMRRFPTLRALARASAEDVLAHWEGLGYYRRATQLHAAARRVLHERGGRMPGTVDQLRSLPGIGPYTAAAIASIAFGADVIALDGNLRRVLSRVFDLSADPGRPEGERKLLDLAQAVLPEGRASAFNQGLMDLGSMICTPRRPDCGRCPLAELCLANRRGTQARRPVRPGRRQVPHLLQASAVVRRAGRVLVRKRDEAGLLGGLWEFPGVQLRATRRPARALARRLSRDLGLELTGLTRITSLHHSYTHRRVTVQVFEGRVIDGARPKSQAGRLRWLRPSELPRYPMGKVDRRIARLLSEGD
jgi:A/G-specific adenine glycosylase